MQPNTEQPMTKQDFITLLEKMNSIEAMLKAQQPAPKKLVLTCAQDVADCLGLKSVWAARDLMRHPNFPESMTKRTGNYNRGKWKTEEVERFFKINKNKV